MNAITAFIRTLKIAPLLLGLTIWLSACAPAVMAPQPAQPTTPPPAPTAVPTAVPQPTAVPTDLPQPTEAPSPTPASNPPQVTLDSSGIASSVTTEQVAATPADYSAAAWAVYPAYTRLTLQGYPVSKAKWEPQIFVYPVSELNTVNPSAGKMVTSLQSLIASPRKIADMPYLPLVDGKTFLHANIQYLDFQNGQGLRYLAQFNNGFTPINNRHLVYTYQGLTSDGRYYVAAMLPVNHPSLPADEQMTDAEMQALVNNYPQNIAKVEANLDKQAANTFTPDLTKLDAMMSSIKVQ